MQHIWVFTEHNPKVTTDAFSKKGSFFEISRERHVSPRLEHCFRPSEQNNGPAEVS